MKPSISHALLLIAVVSLIVCSVVVAKRPGENPKVPPFVVQVLGKDLAVELRPSNDPDCKLDGVNWARAVEVARERSSPIRLAAGGTYCFSQRPAVLPTGIPVMGSGGTGHKWGHGTILVAAYDEPDPTIGFLTWDGSGTYAFEDRGDGSVGNGGKLEDVLIRKAAGFHGGTGVSITGTSLVHRVSWFSLENVFISAYGDGSWDHALVVDGSLIASGGSQGIRDVALRDVSLAAASRANETAVFRNAVHVTWWGGQIFQGPTKAPPGLTIGGGDPNETKSTNVFVSGVNVGGNLVVDGARDFVFDGRVGGDVVVSSRSGPGIVRGLLHGEIRNAGVAVSVGDGA